LSNYTPITDFSVKDALATGNPSKVILGSEVDAELAAIETAIASKLDGVSTYSAETSVADADAVVIYDDSAGSHKKITFANFNSSVKDLKYIGTYTASASATFDIETGIDSSLYGGYLLDVVYLYPSTDATGLRMRIKRGGTYQTTAYSTMFIYTNSSSFPATPVVGATGGLASDGWDVSATTGAPNVSAEALSGIITFPNPHDSTSYMKATGHVVWVGSGGGTNIGHVGGYYGTGGGLQGIRFFSSSGNINGKVNLYGYKV